MNKEARSLDTVNAECEVAFLLALAEHGCEAGIGEVLVQGDGRHCGPGALRKAIAAYDRARAAQLPADVVALVIAAREAWEETCQSGDALDKALEPFASRVPFENEPDQENAL